MTNTPDPTAVRKDAAELSESASAWIRENADPEWRDEDYQWWQLQSRVADAYLALTDPTPLTVEVLVGMGFVSRKHPGRMEFGRLSCNMAANDWIVHSQVLLKHWSVFPQPRTAGELAMLLAMMEGR